MLFPSEIPKNLQFSTYIKCLTSMLFPNKNNNIDIDVYINKNTKIFIQKE